MILRVGLKSADSLQNNKIIKTVITALLFIFSAVIVMLNLEIKAAVLMAILWCIILVLTDDFLLTMAPLFLTTVFITRCYDSFNDFIIYWWVAIPVVLSLIFHFIRFPIKIELGKSVYGLAAVSIALVLGGIGSISPNDYFKPITLYYTIGLGLGMILVHLLFRPYLKLWQNVEKLMICIYLMGALSSFCVARFYIADINNIIETLTPPLFQSSNNLATMLMIALPIPCYFARKNKVHILMFVIMYFSIILTTSRGGVLFGTLEMAICVISMLVLDKKNRLYYAIISVAGIVIFGSVLSKIQSFIDLDFSVFSSYNNMSFVEKVLKFIKVDENHARYKLLISLKDDFINNPIFGNGIGFHGHEDVYSPVKGAMNWYHMWLPQIIGSMGLVGIIAYGYNLFVRIKLFVSAKSFDSYIIILSYLGLFLMSQVNPGEFCPIPYSMIAVMLFACIDQPINKNIESLK